MSIFSKNIVFLRKKRELTQAEIADSIGYKRTTWNNYEQGVSEPNFEGVIKIAKFFDISLNDLLTFDLNSDVHLIKKTESEKNIENVHVNVHPSVHLNPENRSKEHYLKASETVLNTALNEPGGPSDNTKDQITELYSKINALEQIIANKLASIEEDISKLKTKK